MNFFYFGAHLYYASYNFVTGYHGEYAAAPFVLDLVKVEVANAAEQDVELYIAWSYIAALKVPGREAAVFGLCSIGFCCNHRVSF